MVETSGSSHILRISPKVDDLLPNKQLKCPEAGCTSIFNNTANLQMHLERHHRIESIKTDTSNSLGIPERWYFCPVEGCPYFDTGKDVNKHFVCLKYVRQHYQKVHAAKVYQCEKCGKTFGTEGMRIRHENVCGQTYKCDQCGWSYNSRETLLTHARRKGHVVDLETKKNGQTSLKRTTPSNETVIIGTQTTTPIQILVKLSTQTQDQEVQTEPVKIKVQQQRRKRGPSTPKSSGKSAKKSRSISTGTSTQPSTSVDLEAENPIHNSSPDSNLVQINYVDDTEMEDSLNTCLEHLVNSSGSLCDIETQTETFTSTILDQMLYSHMYTQTCDEFLSELGLADIQTQTNLPDTKDEPAEVDMGSGRNAYSMTSSGAHDEMLVSTETQTSFTQCLLEYNEAGTNSNGITQHTQTCDTLLEGLFGGQESDLIGNFQSTYTQT